MYVLCSSSCVKTPFGGSSSNESFPRVSNKETNVSKLIFSVCLKGRSLNCIIDSVSSFVIVKVPPVLFLSNIALLNTAENR